MSINLLASIAGVIGTSVAVVTFLWSVYQYIKIKEFERRQAEFENFHQIIHLLTGEKKSSVASQLAAAFELRNYPNYSSVIETIVRRVPISGPHADLLKSELNATLEELGLESLDSVEK